MKRREKNYRFIKTPDGDIEIEEKFLWVFWIRLRNKQGVVEYFIDIQTAKEFLKDLHKKSFIKEEIVGYHKIKD